MTFKEYISRARAGDNPRGDFIRDARADTKMPDDFASWEDLESFLRRVHFASSDAIDAGKAAWRSYQVAMRRK